MTVSFAWARTTYILFKHINIYIYYITTNNLVLATIDFKLKTMFNADPVLNYDFIVGAITAVTRVFWWNL